MIRPLALRSFGFGLTHGLLHSDILSCSPVEKEDLREDEVYVRRLVRAAPTLEFRPNNPNFIHLDWSTHHWQELWKVDGFYSTILDTPSMQEERIALLEKKVSELERWMRQH